MALVFLATAIILWRLIPEPHKPTDYLVIGSVATFAAMGVLGVVLVSARGKEEGPLVKRRKA